MSQRIFYFHVPVAILSLLSVVVVAVASGVHLFGKGERSDAVAYASAEVGFVFCTIAIVTGAIWAKPVWGVWWTWDPKLTLTLVLWFIYAAYLMLRAFGPKGSQGARYGAVLALIGAIDAPIIYYAAELWRSTHPNLVIGPARGERRPRPEDACDRARLAHSVRGPVHLPDHRTIQPEESGDRCRRDIPVRCVRRCP